MIVYQNFVNVLFVSSCRGETKRKQQAAKLQLRSKVTSFTMTSCYVANYLLHVLQEIRLLFTDVFVE